MKKLILLLLLTGCFQSTEPTSPFIGSWIRVAGDGMIPTRIDFSSDRCTLYYGDSSSLAALTLTDKGAKVLYYGDAFTFLRPHGDSLWGFNDQIGGEVSHVFTFVKQ